MTTTLAAIASIPSRAHHLARALASLRPQVDRLCVYLNGYETVPTCVREFADEHVLDAENRGAEAKLHWADRHDGVVLTCDDDFVCPPEYVATMVAAVEQWQGMAIVTAHGRTYRGRPRHVGLFSEVPLREAEEQDEEEQERREEQRDAKLEQDAERLLAEVLKARAKGAELKSRHDVRALARGKQAWRAAQVAHLFATGQLVGGHGKPIGPPQERTEEPPTPPQEVDGFGPNRTPAKPKKKASKKARAR